MYRLLRPLIFLRDPEWCHTKAINLGRFMAQTTVSLGLLRAMYGYEHPMLATSVGTIELKNPVGLGAGFDKNARIYPTLAAIGFGYVELGSITARPCKGNPKPRLWRIPEQKAIRVNFGLMNDGVDAIKDRFIQKRRFGCVLGASITQTNAVLGEKESLFDYYHSYAEMQDKADYITLNLSCPNVNKDCFDLQKREYVEKLLKRLDTLDHPPTFIKLGAMIPDEEMFSIGSVAKRYPWIQGFVLTNLFKKPGIVGGISGLAVQKVSTEKIRKFYQKFGKRFSIIGCGGVFSGKDALDKIEAGASAIQIVTSLIYEGPAAVKKIKRGLAKEMTLKGYTHISDAVGRKSR